MDMVIHLHQQFPRHSSTIPSSHSLPYPKLRSQTTRSFISLLQVVPIARCGRPCNRVCFGRVFAVSITFSKDIFIPLRCSSSTSCYTTFSTFLLRLSQVSTVYLGDLGLIVCFSLSFFLLSCFFFLVTFFFALALITKGTRVALAFLFSFVCIFVV
jgi:hypothetical protein